MEANHSVEKEICLAFSDYFNLIVFDHHNW